MRWAALVALNRLRCCEGLAVRTVDYTSEGGVVVEVVDLSRPVTPETVPMQMMILPSGEIDCPLSGALAA